MFKRIFVYFIPWLIKRISSRLGNTSGLLYKIRKAHNDYVGVWKNSACDGIFVGVVFGVIGVVGSAALGLVATRISGGHHVSDFAVSATVAVVIYMFICAVQSAWRNFNEEQDRIMEALKSKGNDEYGSH